MTRVDAGYDFQHTLIRCLDSHTIVDPTPLQVLKFAGYHGAYIDQFFPRLTREIVGSVRIAEFDDTPAGSRAFADSVAEIDWSVREQALPIQDKLEMLHGKPFLDMSKRDIGNALRDLWDMNHYVYSPEDDLDDGYRQAIGDVALRMARVEVESV